MEKLTDLLRHRSRAHTDRTAYLVREDGRFRPYTWGHIERRVDEIAAGMIDRGIRPGDRVSILGDTRLEWALCDLAVLRAGGVSVGIYPTLTGEQAAFILEDSSSSWLFVQNTAQIEKISPFFPRLPLLRNLVLWEGDEPERNAPNLSRLESDGAQTLLRDPQCTVESERATRPEDVAIIIYTSGTTGPPKGSLLTHRNIMAQLAMLEVMGPMDERDVMMFFLPLSHVGERIPGHFQRIYRGVPAAFVADITRILEDMRAIRPTVFGSVPRVFEKAYARIRAEVENASPLKRALFGWAEAAAREAAGLERSGAPVPLTLRLRRAAADRMVFRKVRAVFGGRVRTFVSSSAPISLEILEFFHAAGMTILEGYGQTEVSCFCTFNRPDDYRLGSVGKPLPDTEIRIAQDGEILVRGPTVFKGYLNQPELTRTTVDEDGWLHTGDIGRLDRDGFLWITGRKKEIIITSGGKNVTPANIEHLLCDHPLVEQALVHGDRRNYLTALLGLSPDAVRSWAERTGPAEATAPDLLRHPALLAELQGHVDRVNERLARNETIKRFAVLPRLLDLDHGELTPTQKIRRQVVEDRFRDLLNSLYESA